MTYHIRNGHIVSIQESRVAINAVSEYISTTIKKMHHIPALDSLEHSQYTMRDDIEVIEIFSDSGKTVVEIDYSRISELFVKEPEPVILKDDYVSTQYSHRLPYKIVVRDFSVDFSTETVTFRNYRDIDTKTSKFFMLFAFYPSIDPKHPLEMIQSNHATVQEVLDMHQDKDIIGVSLYDKKNHQMLQLWSKDHGYLY